MKFLLLSLAMILALSSCDDASSADSGMIPGASDSIVLDGLQIFEADSETIESIIQRGLSKFSLIDEEVRFSGLSYKKAFASRDELIIQGVTTKQVADRLHSDFKSMPKANNGQGGGTYRTGDNLVGVVYFDGRTSYFIDAVLLQVAEDVKITFLYKATR